MYRIFIIILLTTFLHGQNNALRWALAGQATDLLITEIALARGATELNPLMVHQPARIAAKVGLSAILVIYAKRYPEDKRTMTIFAVLSWLPVGYTLIKGI